MEMKTTLKTIPAVLMNSFCTLVAGLKHFFMARKKRTTIMTIGATTIRTTKCWVGVEPRIHPNFKLEPWKARSDKAPRITPCPSDGRLSASVSQSYSAQLM
eukprot:4728959-Amphidinium_carterae.3